MLFYKKKLVKVNEGEENECDCFMYLKEDGWCYSLTICGTKLARITDSKIWDRCKDLRIVILLMNELIELPQELSIFSDTIELICIQHNNFTKVPPIVFDLKYIRHLNLHGNQISEFPNEMKVFVNLEHLKFGDNRLYSLPDIFQRFQLLTEIKLNVNFLTRLPPSFAELKQLESIDLTNNSFTCIPAPLLKLPKLKVLYLDWNRIQRLAPLEDHEGKDTFELLCGLVSLRLTGNPVYAHLLDGSDLLKQVTNPTIYYSKLQKVPILQALRVLVLGSCGAGKTSIVEALSFNKYVTPASEAHHDHTVGINRFSIPIRMKTGDTKTEIVTELRLWDFAGERSYIMMNNLFLTDGTLIWIAVNFQTYNCTNESFHKNIAGWLQQLMTKAVRPIIWIIGTHTDKCTKDEVGKKVRHIREEILSGCKKFQQELKKELEKLKWIKEKRLYKNRSPDCVQQNIDDLTKLVERNVPCFVAKYLKVICLTNTHTFSGYDDFRTYITHLLLNTPLDHLTTPLTDSQQRATDKLRQKTEELLAKKEVPVLDLRDVMDILESELGTDSNKEAKKLLQYLYRAGSLLVCEPDSEIILDVDWLIGLLAQVFHHDFPAMIDEKKAGFSLTSDAIEQAVYFQQKTGIVVKPLLEALWSDSLTITFFNRLIQLLENYGLAYETEDCTGCLFPWLLSNHCPDPSKIKDEKRILTLEYEFSPCLPPCFLQRLVVKCKKHYSIKVVYMDAFVVYASKKLSLASNSFTILSVYISILPEPNKMCGKLMLIACTHQEIDISMHSNLLVDLWKMLMTIVKEMECLLCDWRFYGNLQRKVCCPQCLKPNWDLPIQNWSYQEGFEPVFECMKPDCSHITPPNHVLPPTELRFKQYVDHEHFFGSISPLPSNLRQSASLPQFQHPYSGSPVQRRTHADSTPSFHSTTNPSADPLPIEEVGERLFEMDIEEESDSTYHGQASSYPDGM